MKKDTVVSLKKPEVIVEDTLMDILKRELKDCCKWLWKLKLVNL